MAAFDGQWPAPTDTMDAMDTPAVGNDPMGLFSIGEDAAFGDGDGDGDRDC
jgi:hypothetical protein